ncbi:MAG TPA: gamma carbonic anhydrase family protein [Bacillota bacterium]|jgi:carbonic anhydrase/acetyltransferase-like protein (isoleucine patch superfamily)|nr:gamma carbonic anhydrase family protein [Bacillota bacterium]HOB87390.1 gamma carbonic anhydrase family protein [Bacillota bacterium]HOP69083.1 gamma carbonic anhydrase family protein [Bacillota bacterium]HPT34310.1 gamma carbonic anhydrase family protein [Bacillota bacterium]HPZ64282.1 gamma carbonic anhydrase family protein [Bacillota bacterium]
MLIEFNGKKPQVAPGAFIAPTATLIGDVVVEEGASIWFGAVLRGDFDRIVVGKNSSIQDNVVIHVAPGAPTHVGSGVTVGHGAVLHGCQVESGAVIGVRAVLMDFCRVGEQAMIAAGSVVTNNTEIPPRHLAAGIPAQVKKEIGGTSLAWVVQSSQSYRSLAQSYLDQGIDRLGEG